ncbi:MAG: BglG family transcription antiterminator [Alicyclobacillus sp.]|nr:BglG family transcription antiterminator [Alicyclobacillus sp.]
MTSALTDRQKYVLYLLLEQPNGVDADDLARRLDVSRRTVHRDLQAIGDFLAPYRLQLRAERGRLAIAGAAADVARMREAAGVLPRALAVTPRDREVLLAAHLLLEEGPLKLGYLGKRLHVTAASLSHQLDGVDAWLQDNGLNVIRRPGYGVEVTGDEVRRRETLADLLHARLSPIDLMKALRNTDGGETPPLFLTWLERWFHRTWLKHAEAVLQSELQRVTPALDEASFYNFMLHVVLSCARVRQGAEIPDRGDGADKQGPDAAICRRILGQLLPEQPVHEGEVAYLAKHLRGAKTKIVEDVRLFPMNLTAMDLAFQLTRELELSLEIPLSKDQALVAGLAQHLEPAIHRMTVGLSIRNPLLAEVKRQYPDFFKAVGDATNRVLEPYGIQAPEEEIGYLTMHLGAAYERRLAERMWRVRIVCPNGISSAQLLASRLKKEFPNIQVTGIESLQSLQTEDADFVVSTVAVDDGERPVAVVSPFLTDADIARVQDIIAGLERHLSAAKAKSAAVRRDRHFEGSSAAAAAIASRAALFTVEVDGLSAAIHRAAVDAVEAGDAADGEAVRQAIVQRERLGSVVLPGKRLAVLHARSDAMHRCRIAVYRLRSPISVRGVGTQEEPVDTILVMLARVDEELDVIDLLGRLSAMLVTDPHLVDVLSTEDIGGVRQALLTSMQNCEE